MKKVFWVLLFSAAMAGNVFAHPPTEMVLSYDKETKTLHIDIKHVSDSLREHNIRRIIIYRNEEEAQALNFNTQKPPGLTEDVVVETKSGDILRVKAISSEGGKKEATLTVSVDESVEEAPPSDTPAEKLSDDQP